MNKLLIYACGLTLLFCGVMKGQDTLSWWVEKIGELREPAFLPNTLSSITTIIPAETMIEKARAVVARADRQLRDEARWVGGVLAESLMTDESNIDEFLARFSGFANETFVQALIVAPGSEVFVMGDLHGSLHSLVRTLYRLKEDGYIDDNFSIIKPDFYMIFLGDYTDRGAYATEVIYLIFSLFLKNPGNVVALRGNHEDIAQQESESAFPTFQGFQTELFAKYQERGWLNIFKAISRWYSRLPVALYLGSGTSDVTDFIQLNHGGIEAGFFPRLLFTFADHKLGAFYQTIVCTNEDLRKRLIEFMSAKGGVPVFSSLKADASVACGFTWGDFSNVVHGTGTSLRGYFFKTKDAQQWMNLLSDDFNKWRAIIRGHQHSSEPLAFGQENFAGCNVHDWRGMWPCTAKNLDVGGKVAYKLADYPMYTLLSIPALSEILPGQTFDSFALVKTAEDFDDWTIRLAEFRPAIAESVLEPPKMAVPKLDILKLALGKHTQPEE